MMWKVLNKLKRLPVFAALLTYVFVVSGLVVSLLCLLLLVLWPISKTLYRKIVAVLVYSVTGQIVWISEEWAGMKVHMFGEEGVYDKFGKESCLMTLSHRGDLDWVAGLLAGAHYNFLHSIKTLPKQSVLFIPGFGQVLWALEDCFLTRNAARDMEAIRKISEVYKDYPFPIQVCIFCEGTRFSQAKYEKGVQYAKEKGLKALKHHLIPRTKGFAALAYHLKLKSNFPALYDVAFAYPNVKIIPGFLDILLGRPVNIFFYLRRIPMEDIPSSQEELNTFCYKLYEHKDEAYEHFVQTGEFPTLRQPFLSQRRVTWGLRLNQLFWTVFLCSPPFYLSLFLSSSTVAIIVGIGISVSTLLMLALLLYARQTRTTATVTKKTN